MSEKSRHKERLAAAEALWRSHILTLETQMAKQRERALNLVKEKDEEIAELKDSLNTLIPKQFSADKVENFSFIYFLLLRLKRYQLCRCPIWIFHKIFVAHGFFCSVEIDSI